MNLVLETWFQGEVQKKLHISVQHKSHRVGYFNSEGGKGRKGVFQSMFVSFTHWLNYLTLLNNVKIDLILCLICKLQLKHHIAKLRSIGHLASKGGFVALL